MKIQPLTGAQKTYKKKMQNTPANTAQKNFIKKTAPNGRPENLQNKQECTTQPQKTPHNDTAQNGRPEKLQKI